MIRQAFLLRAGRAVGLSTASGAASASNPASSGAAQTARAGLLSVGLRGVANSPLLAVPDARTGGHMVEHSSEKLTVRFEGLLSGGRGDRSWRAPDAWRATSLHGEEGFAWGPLRLYSVPESLACF